jgi:hypothetical protein
MDRSDLQGRRIEPYPKIAIVITHFGRVPFWLPAFFLSCRENPEVQWLIYTDIDVGGPVPPNVEIKPMQLHEFNERSSDALGTKIDIRPTALPKLCDLKPTYGVLFADDLRPFDFWTHSEFDIIWGDIRHFMTRKILVEYDLISACHYELAGHFTLFRNTERLNRLFEIIPNVYGLLADPHHFRLDERVLTNELLVLMEGRSSSCPRIYWEPQLTMSAQYQRGLPDGPGGNLWWCRGKTYDADCNELMYLHFHKFKNHMNTINFGFEDAPATFMINRTGLYRRSTHGRFPSERG